MKLRRLPETDLARIAPLSVADKHAQLRAFNSGGGSWSYAPAREQNFNIANPKNPMGLQSPRPSLEKIKALVARSCSREEQEDSCVEVVELFFNWFTQNASDAIERHIPSMGIGTLGVVRYWENFAAMIDGRPCFFFLDYRRNGGLTSRARRFAFSMMNEQIRRSDPDFSDANLMILQFTQKKGEARIVKSYSVDEGELYSLSDLSEMIDETYKIWQDVLMDRRDDTGSKRAGGLL